MSRSIHTTRRHLEEERRLNEAEQGAQAQEIRHIRRELTRKRRLKQQVLEERRAPQQHHFSLAESIEIFVEDEGDFVHYPAGPSDLVELMERLPLGITQGLRCIRLTPGVLLQEQTEPEGERDPLLNRVGVEILPGVFSGHILGRYNADKASIDLYAYIYAPDAMLRPLKELYVRAAMLSTLAHELGHHHDYQARIARGRWLADNKEKKEIYAESREHEWQLQCIIPLLEERYPMEVAALFSWLALHGGALAPEGRRHTLYMLLGDPRRTRKGGQRRADLFSVRGALCELMKDVEEGLGLVQTRVGFARELHYGEHYNWARCCLAKALEEAPVDPEALTLIADIDVHEGQHEHAEALCRQVLSKEPERLETLEVLADSFEARGLWEDLLTTTARILALSPDNYALLRALRQRGIGLFSLSKLEEMPAVIAALRALPGRLAPSTADALEAMRLLRRGQLEEALALAVSASSGGVWLSRVLLAAVRTEAALLLRRPEEAKERSECVGRLTSMGLTDWAERLSTLR